MPLIAPTHPFPAFEYQQTAAPWTPPKSSSSPSVIVSSKKTSTSAERNEFFVLIKIFFKYIDKTQMDKMKRHCKAIIADCTHRNRRGDPDCCPLQDALRYKLRMYVGEIHWNRVQKCYDVYRARRFWKISKVPQHMAAV